MNNHLFPPSNHIPNDFERKRRILYGALSGFLAGTIFAIVTVFINTWLYPDLPIYISWTYMFRLWLLWAGMTTVLAGISAISSENWSSILLSAFLMTLTILIANFSRSSNSLPLTLVMILGLALPFTAVMMPIAYVFFWLSRRFVKAGTAEFQARGKLLLVNVLVIFVLGFLPGLYAKFNIQAETGMRLVYEMLQSGTQADAADVYPIQLRETEGYAQHKGQSYTLSQEPSSSSTVGVDVIAHFDDGYELMCTVTMYDIANPNIRSCTLP